MENGLFIVDLPVTNWIFHSYVELPEGTGFEEDSVLLVGSPLDRYATFDLLRYQGRGAGGIRWAPSKHRSFGDEHLTSI